MQIQFFWHMHQPLYIRDEKIDMPWVFLHAIKDYFDMPYLIEKTNSRATFNLTATLIEQIKIYEKEPLRDRFLSLWIREPHQLDEKDKRDILKVIKAINSNLIINNRLKELLEFDLLSDIEFINLEVLFMLSWCGVYLKKEKLKDFIKKDRYTQLDKEYLFNILIDFIKIILPYYKKLLDRGVISLFTTPYSHPILPLLLDIRSAKEANRDTTLPKNPIDLRDDAILHIKKSKKIYRDTFNIDTIGLWPAEGAVSSDSIKLYNKNEIKYIATDEEILHRSGESNHHRVYIKDDVIIFFRDHSLSDLIGFKYRFLDIDIAVDDFISQLPNGDSDIVSIIVDGENAWEFYRDGGYNFLEKLYLRLKDKMIRAEDIKDTTQLRDLASGSWIYGNFNTWVGDSEKNLAWEYLFKAKAKYLSSGVKNSKIDEKFLLAECSDWFWWYGDGHYTDFAEEFDELFRRHLIDIYSLMKIDIPNELFIPIIKEKRVSFIDEPTNSITPTINGKFGSIFEWYGAGIIDERKIYSTMDRVKFIEKIYFGMDRENFYFALYGNIKPIDKIVLFIDNQTIEVTKNYNRDGITVRTDRIIEIKVNKNIVKKDRVSIKFDLGVEIVPSLGEFFIDKNCNYLDNWFI